MGSEVEPVLRRPHVAKNLNVLAGALGLDREHPSHSIDRIAGGDKRAFHARREDVPLRRVRHGWSVVEYVRHLGEVYELFEVRLEKRVLGKSALVVVVDFRDGHRAD